MTDHTQYADAALVSPNGIELVFDSHNAGDQALKFQRSFCSWVARPKNRAYHSLRTERSSTHPPEWTVRIFSDDSFRQSITVRDVATGAPVVFEDYGLEPPPPPTLATMALADLDTSPLADHTPASANLGEPD